MERSGRAVCGLRDAVGEVFFPRTGVDEDASAEVNQALGDGGIAFDWPPFCSQPAPGLTSTVDCAGDEDRTWSAQDSAAGSMGSRLGGREFITGYSRGQFNILLDDMSPVGWYALRKKRRAARSRG